MNVEYNFYIFKKKKKNERNNLNYLHWQVKIILSIIDFNKVCFEEVFVYENRITNFAVFLLAYFDCF